MTIVTDFGVTPSGFVLKPVDVLLNEAIDRARSVFPGADLTTTSALFKILQTTAAEDGELWKRLEDLYFGNVMSTAIGHTLDQLGEAVTVTNRAATTGGTGSESDESYRNRLLGLARNLWTVDAVAQAALGVDGVVDVVLSDPLGGVDISQSYFDLFNFDQRAFSSERRA